MDGECRLRRRINTLLSEQRQQQQPLLAVTLSAHSAGSACASAAFSCPAASIPRDRASTPRSGCPTLCPCLSSRPAPRFPQLCL